MMRVAVVLFLLLLGGPACAQPAAKLLAKMSLPEKAGTKKWTKYGLRT